MAPEGTDHSKQPDATQLQRFHEGGNKSKGPGALLSVREHGFGRGFCQNQSQHRPNRIYYMSFINNDLQKINRNFSGTSPRISYSSSSSGLSNFKRSCKHLGSVLRPYHRGFTHVEVVLDRGCLIREAPHSPDLPVGEMSDDARLVAAAREGDRTAFGQLYERHARFVHGVLLAHAPFAEVDDLVHDVFITALRRLDTLREPAAFAGWLLAIARNRAIDFHRRSHATEELPEETSGHDPGEYEARAALEAIQSLPEAYRETLVLRLVEGMTGPEIAARTGLTHASVRVNLHRGMKQLREKLGRSETHE